MMPGEFYTMPGVLYNARRFLQNARSSAAIQGPLEQLERGFFDGVDILGTHRLDFRKKSFSLNSPFKEMQPGGVYFSIDFESFPMPDLKKLFKNVTAKSSFFCFPFIFFCPPYLYFFTILLTQILSNISTLINTLGAAA